MVFLSCFWAQRSLFKGQMVVNATWKVKKKSLELGRKNKAPVGMIRAALTAQHYIVTLRLENVNVMMKGNPSERANIFQVPIAYNGEEIYHLVFVLHVHCTMYYYKHGLRSLDS